MTEARYILVHDLGTTGDKAIIFDEVGRVITSHYISYKTYYPQPTWVEQKPEDWWDVVCTTTKLGLKKSKLLPKEIKAVAMVGQEKGAVPVDKEVNLVREKTILWCDTRSSKQAKELIDKIGGYDAFYRIHGLGFTPESLSISKVMWIKENEPKVYEKTYKFLQSKDFIIARLTDGVAFVDDYSDASLTGWLDIVKRDYSEEILELAGINVNKLPELHNSDDIVGYVGDEAAEKVGLKPGTPIIIGAGDVAAACVGAGVVKEKLCYSYIGSCNWNGVYATKPCLDSTIRLNNQCHPWKGYDLFSLTMAGGISQQWFGEAVCDLEVASAKRLGVSLYDLMRTRMLRTPVGSMGLCYLPYLRGGGGPHWNPNARGAFVGLVVPHNKDHFIRAVLEGVAINFRWLMDQTERAGFQVYDWGELRMIGGGGKNMDWLHIYADVLNMRVLLMDAPQEATGRGAFIAGAVGLGWYKNYIDATEKVVKINKIVEPNLNNHKIYDEMYDIYKSAFKALTPVFDKIAKFQVKYNAL